MKCEGVKRELAHKISAHRLGLNEPALRILPAFSLVNFKLGWAIGPAAHIDECVATGLFITVMIEDKFFFVSGRDDRIDGGSIGRLTEGIVSDINLSWLGVRINSPDKNMMADRLGINLGLPGWRLPLQAEASSSINTNIILKVDILRWLAAFVSSKSSTIEIIISEIKPLGNMTGFPALVRYPGVVNIVKIAVLHRDITGPVP